MRDKRWLYLVIGMLYGFLMGVAIGFALWNNR